MSQSTSRHRVYMREWRKRRREAPRRGFSDEDVQIWGPQVLTSAQLLDRYAAAYGEAPVYSILPPSSGRAAASRFYPEAAAAPVLRNHLNQ
jgi:hypothetical protein